MANGFLDRNGNFIKATNYNHFDVARDLLRAEGHGEVRYPLEPTEVLCNEYGYLYFREHYNGLCGGVREEALDGVWLSKNFKITAGQCKWIENNMNIVSGRQKELINNILNCA